MRKRQAVEITVTYLPRAWPWVYERGYRAHCRKSACPTPPLWCVRHFYGTRRSRYRSDYWCDEHLPRHHRTGAEAAEQSHYGIYRRTLSPDSRGR